MGDTIVTKWLAMTNAAMMISWSMVLMRLISAEADILDDEQACDYQIGNSVMVALFVSFLELANAVAGATKSIPEQVFLFSIIRFCVETIVTPNLRKKCSAWQHLLTVFCWSVGDSIRFGCFLVDNLTGGQYSLPKLIRYTVGPMIFLMGTLGEVLMVIAVGIETQNIQQKALIFIIAGLWPFGFYYLFNQLLKQRRKYLDALKAKTY